MSIKITVDFTNGCYNVIGKYEGENYPVQKPVRGIDKIDDKTFQFRCSYNIKLMKEGKEEVLKAIKAIVRKYPNFRVSEKDLDQVDYLMYNFLKDWDKMNGYTTRFSIDYLMAITQEIEINNKSEISIEEFEKRCKDARANFLRKIGIEITYNVGLLEKSKKSVFWDEVEYILLANIQKKFIDAEVVNMVQHNLGSQELSFIDIEESEKDEELEQSNVSEDELVDEDDEKILDDDYYLDFDGEDELVDKISEKMKKKSEDRKIVRKIEASDGLRQKSEDIDKRVQKTKDILDKMSLELNEASKKIEQQNKDTDKMIEKNQNDLDIKIETLKAKLDAKSETLKSALNGEKVKINNTNGKSYSPEVAKATLEKINEELQAFINQNKKEEQSEGNKKEIKDNNEFGKLQKKKSWVRVLRSVNDKIKNKKINLDKSTLKGKIIRGFMTLVATAGIFTTAHNISNIVNNLKEEKEVNNSYETEFNESDLDIVEEPIVVFYPNENKLEIQESEIQESEIQETETQETEIQEIENQETETQEIETQETEIQETETQKTETQETETQETEIQEIETKKAETQETETQETETQEAETQETETQEAETQKTEIQETETQESKIQERNEMKEAENKEKLEKFRQDAMVAYMNAFVIGEKPKVGDMLLEKPFSSSPDGSGSIGHFYKDVDYKVEHITIIAPEDWYTIRGDGQSLLEVLSKYPNRLGYSIHFSNTKTKGGLGFVTQEQLEEMINEKIDSIIDNSQRTNQKESNSINEER